MPDQGRAGFLEPMTYEIGPDWVLTHGERSSELDAEHPYACLCGAPEYWACEGWINDDGISGATITMTDKGLRRVE